MPSRILIAIALLALLAGCGDGAREVAWSVFDEDGGMIDSTEGTW